MIIWEFVKKPKQYKKQKIQTINNTKNHYKEAKK